MEEAPSLTPYRTTPVFDENSLPAGLRRDHRTKVGVWGVIRILEGELVLTVLDPPGEQRLTPEQCGLILPDQPHFVTPSGPMRMQVEFYQAPPAI
jgi:tellurite resistance-related uncharacterized protein